MVLGVGGGGDAQNMQERLLSLERGQRDLTTMLKDTQLVSEM